MHALLHQHASGPRSCLVWGRQPRAGRRSSSSSASSRPWRRAPQPARAELLGGGMLDTVVTWGVLSLSVGALAFGVFTPWPGRSATRDSAAASAAFGSGSLAAPEDNFTWALMGGISCLPLFNWMAWVLGALSSDNPRPFYYAAALYVLPLLRNGLDQDWFSLTLLLLGAAHIQALRIAATEPELQARLQQQLQPLSVVATLAGAAGGAARAALGSSSSAGTPLDGLARGGDGAAAPSEPDGSGDEAARQLQEQELRDFDRRLQQRDAQRQLHED